jgi:sporulation protein YqfC
MRVWNRRIRKAVAEWLAIPEDSVLTIPRLTCVGGRNTVIENVTGLIHVSETEVVLDLADCRLRLAGEAFEVTFLEGREVHVHGLVHEIRYEWPKGAPR